MPHIREELRQIKKDILTENHALFEQAGQMKASTDQALEEWISETTPVLENSPYKADYDKYIAWHRKFRFNILEDSEGFLKDYNKFIHEYNLPTNGINIVPKKARGVHSSTEKISAQDQRTTLTAVFKKWQEQLNMLKRDWELEELAKRRLKFSQELNEWLSKVKELADDLEDLGLDPGEWLSFGAGALREQQIAELKKWAEYLKNDEGAKKICELLGRMQREEESTKVERILTSETIKASLWDENSKEEIVGLKPSNEIAHTIPSELALLADSDTELFFDLKFLEKRLLSFDMQGVAFADQQEQHEMDKTVADDDKKGPMILCIDTSGSMSGPPEQISKAMALYLATKAKKESRACYLINFSTKIETLELTKNHALANLIAFLQMSFHGGTDICPALNHSLEKMVSENYKKSDVLIISDFLMSVLPDEIVTQIKDQRKNGNVFNSLVIGNEVIPQTMETTFDNEWVYNPKTSKIQELIHVQEELTI